MIKKLSIKRFKNIKTKALILDDMVKVNYLTGINGSGKSAVLQSLFFSAMISDSNEFLFIHNQEPHKNYVQIKSLFRDSFEILVKEVFGKEIIESSYTFKEERDLTNQNNRIAFEYNSKEGEDVNPSIFKDSTRLVYFDLFNTSFQTGLIQKNNKTDKIKYLNIFDFPRNENLLKLITLDKINKIASVFGIETLSSESYPVIGEVHKQNGSAIYLNEIASGARFLITFLHQIQSEINQEGDVLFLIEEPELSLHPSIQKNFSQLMNEFLEIPDGKDVQFIITTHSPFIISNIDENSKIYLLNDAQTIGRDSKKGGEQGFTGKRALLIASKILGAGFEDIGTKPQISSSRRIIYCEGTTDQRDAEIYQIIFPRYIDKLNVFVPCGGATDVAGQYYSGLLARDFVFGENTELLALIDRSCSTGKGLHIIGDKFIKTSKTKPSFTDKEMRDWLAVDIDHRRILKRKEIENYLYDPEILKKYCTKIEQEFNELEYQKLINDIKLDNVKDSFQEIKSLCTPENIGKENFDIALAKLITDDTGIYKKLRKCLFPTQANLKSK